jgi:septum formation protein
MQILQNSPHLILASKSPRRSYLLEQAGLEFEVIPSDFDESSVALIEPADYVKKLAREKALSIARAYPQSWVIGADTVVLINGTILGKPKSDAQARQMLKTLSGATHRVLSGYSIQCQAQNHIFSEALSTEVCFKKLSEAEITWYIGTREPFDKAGAYAIQGLGTFIVKSIKGSYTNVVGLPVCEVLEHLISAGVVNRL